MLHDLKGVLVYPYPGPIGSMLRSKSPSICRAEGHGLGASVWAMDSHCMASNSCPKEGHIQMKIKNINAIHREREREMYTYMLIHMCVCMYIHMCVRIYIYIVYMSGLDLA